MNVEIVHSFFGVNVLGDITILLFVQICKTEEGCSKETETLNPLLLVFSHDVVKIVTLNFKEKVFDGYRIKSVTKNLLLKAFTINFCYLILS